MARNTWRELPIGGVILEPGNSIAYETGGWRAHRPIIDMAACTHCMMCWLYCPDMAILTQDRKLQGVDLAHCKGCGICAQVCPVKCITMVEESRLQEGG